MTLDEIRRAIEDRLGLPPLKDLRPDLAPVTSPPPAFDAVKARKGQGSPRRR